MGMNGDGCDMHGMSSNIGGVSGLSSHWHDEEAIDGRLFEGTGVAAALIRRYCKAAVCWRDQAAADRRSRSVW